MDTVLVEQQMLDPVNPVLAHDIGLFHYWRAKKENNPDKAAAHWERVIGNWAMVLESETYWKDWCAERQEVYGKTITHEHIDYAKQALNERIVMDLTKCGQNGSSRVDLHLEGAFFLELKAIRLLERTKGIRLPSKNNQRLNCGPLLARQLGILPQVKHLLPISGETLHNKRHSVDVIVAPIKRGSDGLAANDNNVDRQLRLYFSQLGIPFVYLERGESQRTLKILTSLRCPDCEPDTNREEKEQISTNQLPSRCRDDCANFAQWNPAYNFGRAGRDLFYRHAVELNAGAGLCLAQQVITEEPMDMAALLEHIQEALNISQPIGIREALQEEVADTMLGWADGLERQKRWDDAIALLKSTENFEKGERWKGKLAGALNVRGVQRAKQKQWQESVDDLREAHRLNPFVTLFRQNLENALHGYADDAYRTGDDDLARELLTEATHLGEMQPGEQEAEPSPMPTPAEMEITEMPELILDETERVNPALFDQKGVLQLEIFDDSGKTVLELAKEESAAMGEALLRVPALVIALTRYQGGETLRLLELQGIAPEVVQAQARNSTGKSFDSVPLKTTSVLSQFNLWFSILKIFDLAWEIALYDQGQIGEPHICYGLLVSHSAAKLLEGAGADVGQMLQHAGWYEIMEV
jgi:tetratricopeptide (TPR) repeat protein